MVRLYDAVLHGLREVVTLAGESDKEESKLNSATVKVYQASR